MLQHNRQIIISTGTSRKAAQWPGSTIWWSELVEKLKTPVRSTETINAYLSMSKSEQDDLKDVGGFVGGSLLGNRRKALCVTGRDVLTLDLDNIPSGGTQDALRRLDGLGCAFLVYSTRKHRPDAPRLRVLFPVCATAGPDEYEPALRMVSHRAGLLPWCDPSTFEVSRLMYWPSVCADGEYIHYVADKPFLSVEGVLGLFQDWHNIAQWPQIPGAPAQARLAAKQGDPTVKSGVVGAFCRTYDIFAAIDSFLPGIYEETDLSDRYTYTGGSTTGGAVTYDNGLYLYSHHATDPCGGKLVNAFDLVRLHKFGDLDDEAKPGTPTGRLPSYTEMQRLAVADEKVAALLNSERYQTAIEAFKTRQAGAEISVPEQEENTEWLKQLDLHPQSGLPSKTINNVKLIIQNDPLLRGRIRLNLFADAYMARGPLPWELRREEQGVFQWADRDDRGLRNYIEMVYGLKGRELIEDGLGEAAAALAYDPILEYLNSGVWDNTPRLDTVYIDYLGADDSPYMRAVNRKAFVAAVARAKHPGVKFDCMTVICGRQGLGKSTLFSKLGAGWFSDSLKTFEGKDAAELLQGVWICEIAELESFNKADIRIIKSFLSKLDDQYRAAYARKTDKHPRRCVFFGTTNDHDYLKDPTGNRRFWPVDAELQVPTKSVFKDLDDATVAQIWAEAAYRWQQGETLFLSPELEAEADRRREDHFDTDPLQGQIEEFLEKPVPADWQEWNLDRRRMYWSGQISGASGIKLVTRDRVCVMEIMRECMRDIRPSIPRADSNRVVAILTGLKNWERCKSTMRFGCEYGIQKGFKRVNQQANFCPELVYKRSKPVNLNDQAGLQSGLQENPLN